MSGHEDLVPKSARGLLSQEDREELDSDRQGGKEYRFVIDTLKALGWGLGRIYKEADREGGRLDFVWAWNEQLTPVHMSYAEIARLDIIQLYTTPTKSPVWEAFYERRKAVTEHTDELSLIMPFTCRNLNQRAFAMHNVESLVQVSKVYLTFIVRNVRHFVQPWKEVVSAIERIWREEEGVAAQAF